MIYIVIVSVLLGLVIGYSSPLVIPVAYSKIFSVALVAALDAAFGGLRAVVSERFDKRVFVTGFFSNTLLAAALVFIGDRLDPEGNDYPVKVLGVPCHAVTGWRDTAEFVTALAGDLAAARGRGK